MRGKISANGPDPMKIGTLLTAAIVSLATVGGGLAAYVAVTKYQTMDKVSVAQKRLAIVRAVGDVPRYMNPERGFATNILFGSGSIDPKQTAELDKLRALTDGAMAKVTAGRASLPGALDDGEAVGNCDRRAEGEIRSSARGHRQCDSTAPADTRRAAGNKIVADNAAFNAGVTLLLDEQVRRLAALDGAPTGRRATPTSPGCCATSAASTPACTRAWWRPSALRPTPRSWILSRSNGRTEQILSTLQELRKNPATPANVTAALGKMQSDYVERFGSELKFAREGADQRQIRARRRHLLCGIADRPRRRHHGARRLLRQRRTRPGGRLFVGAFQLPGRARRPDRRRRRKLRPDRDGPSPHPRPHRRADRPHVAACRGRRRRGNSRRRRAATRSARWRPPCRYSRTTRSAPTGSLPRRKPRTTSRCAAPARSTISRAPSRPRSASSSAGCRPPPP